MRTALASLALLATLAGCATFDEALGRPDALDWTYFEGSQQDVLGALQSTLQLTQLRVESTRSEGGGTVVTIVSRAGSGDVSEVLVQATEVEGFGARAQVYPANDPLPRWLEMEISGRM